MPEPTAPKRAHWVKKTPPSESIVSLRFAGAAFDISAATIRRRQLRGELTTYRIGNAIRCDLAEVRALMLAGGGGPRDAA